MRDNRDNLPFLTSLFLILVMVYNNSWLPGVFIIFPRITYIIMMTLVFTLVTAFNFDNFIKLSIRFSSFEKSIIFILIFLVLYDTILYNPAEFSKLKSIEIFVCYLLIFITYFWFFPNLILKELNLFELFIKFISNLGLILAIFGFFDLIFNLHDSGYAGALVSVIHHPNNTSIVFTITVFPTLFYLYWKWKSLSLYSKIFYVFSFVIQLAAQLMTYTRAGMIATMVGLLIFLGLKYRSRFFMSLPFIAILLPGFVVSFVKLKGFASFISRFYLLIPAFGMIFDNKIRLLWGYGVTNGLDEYRKRLVEFNPTEFLIEDPHNTYVSLLIIMGAIFTLTLVIFVLILIVKGVKRIISKNNDNDLIYIFLTSSIVSIMIQGLFDTELIKIQCFTIHYLSIIIGLMFILVTNKNFRKFKTMLYFY